VIVIKGDNPIYFDVDDTLIMWDIPSDRTHEAIDIHCYGVTSVVRPHHKHIELLKLTCQRDRQIIVWSQRGYKWAEAVVKVLKLEEYVDAILTKPIAYVDDLAVEDWMVGRIYINDK
jgi:hydroxymethylpyrimidine pyrophosphatase-like HAD family hydrolase